MNLVIIFLSTLLLGVPIIAVLGLTSIIPMQIDATIPFSMVAQSAFSGVNQLVLMAVAGFIFAGIMMEKSGITDGLLEFSKEAVGRLTGGYAILTIFMSTFFAALTGAGPACTAAVGAMTLPLMIKGGYEKGFASSVAAVGGTLGIMIPPSNPMMIYALLAGLSVSDMFIAGILPGILIALMLMLVSWFICKKRGYSGTKQPFSIMKFLVALWKSKWGIMAPLLILGGIYGGVVTATESAILAIFYAIVVGVITRKLKLKDFFDGLRQTAIMCGSIVSIVGVAAVFGRVLTVYRIPQAVGGFLMAITTDPVIFQLLVILIMLFVGTWMEPISSLVILVPIFMPLVRQLGIDIIAFGILMTLTTQIAFITPPVAANLFVVSKISNTSIEAVSKQIIPYLAVLVLAAMVIIFVPQIATFLPSLSS